MSANSDSWFYCVCVYALQVVSDEVYKSWSANRQRALAALENREELVMETAVQLETNLSLLGNTQSQTLENHYIR